MFRSFCLWLAAQEETFSVLNLFRYITFRTGGAVVTAFLVSFLTAPSLIRWLKKKQKEGQPIRTDGPDTHLVTKKGTPTMGGIIILLAHCIATLLWCDWNNVYVWVVLGTLLVFGAVGAWDDFLKLTRQSHKGLPGLSKLLAQGFVACAAVWVILVQQAPAGLGDELFIPFTKHFFVHLGWFYVPFALVVIAGSSNAVNLTDGLDGLAIVPVMMVAGCFCILSYGVGHVHFARYLGVPYVPGAGELTVVCGGLVGAGLGFLWYNAPPARVFMGDTGSLSMGGALGVISLITRHELVLALAGGLFVLEALSVILQVGFFRLKGKRIFRMAPLHHHFEKKGWSETTVVIRFWILSVLFTLLALSTLKVR
jgi:phospho-N-acetylmuramoyl-pentapeptide-transferase